MKNKPGKIFLQVGEESFIDFDFKKLDVSWCSAKINDNDLEFISIEKYNELKKTIDYLIKRLDKIESEFLCQKK